MKVKVKLGIPVTVQCQKIWPVHLLLGDNITVAVSV